MAQALDCALPGIRQIGQDMLVHGDILGFRLLGEHSGRFIQYQNMFILVNDG